MAAYKLTLATTVIRTSDGAHIPNNRGNRDWREYQEWLVGGNTPDPADPEIEETTVSRIDNEFTNSPVFVGVVAALASAAGLTEAQVLDAIKTRAVAEFGAVLKTL